MSCVCAANWSGSRHTNCQPALYDKRTNRAQHATAEWTYLLEVLAAESKPTQQLAEVLVAALSSGAAGGPARFVTGVDAASLSIARCIGDEKCAGAVAEHRTVGTRGYIYASTCDADGNEAVADLAHDDTTVGAASNCCLDLCQLLLPVRVDLVNRDDIGRCMADRLALGSRA